MIKAITGTKDILPDEIQKWLFFEKLVREEMAFYNYQEIRTPVFEETALFARSIGEATDIVSKEMYTFIDRSEVSITLKPEMTASVVRAFIEHSLGKKQGLNKLFYISPMFRQERPQAGRLRQFHQIGVEAIGSANPVLDAEMIIIAFKILERLGLKNLSVKINSLGIPESREKYKLLLANYLQKYFEELSDDSKKRFHTNILRIFDSKDERDIQLMKNAPLLLEHLDNNSLLHFEQVRSILTNLKLPYEIEPKLVRGLDYYTHTTFEIISNSIGSQSALCGGGRYDLLIEQLGGEPTPGVGFAAGIERILLACENEKLLNLSPKIIDIYIIRLEKELFTKIYEISHQLREQGLSIEIDYLDRSVKAQMREANKLNAKYVIIIGGNEYKNNNFILKNMSNGEEKLFSADKIFELENIINE
ncbi:MAG: histidine--tRNA ligase [Ignavibacteriales bacterium]|nr:histidine--tRNA ligase [Ignavibacteriales bacterium]